LLVGAGLLVVVIAGFLVFAHYRARRFLAELPKKLGADIRQETSSYTWSQTVKGRTVFTLHAAKAVQHKDGKYTLHDVGIAVYGHGQERGDRVDRIYGKEFDVDQAEGVVRANGEVHLDLEAPAAADAKGKMDYAAGKDLKGTEPAGSGDAHEVGKGDARLIHVKTSGLVYLQKLGVAATDNDIEFEYNGLTGHAKGAEYNADTGVLVLQSAVKVSGLQKGQPVLLTASRAEMDRTNHTVVLSQAKYVTVAAGNNDGAVRQTVEARHATVTIRPDGSAERLEGDSGVTLTGGDGSRMTAERGDVVLGATSKPKSLKLTGQVKYFADDPERQARGEASEAHVAFDGNGHAEKVTLGGAVHLTEHVNAVGARAASDRELKAATVELAMAFENGKSKLRNAKASGDARLKVVDAARSGRGMRSNTMAAEVLTARFVQAAPGQQRIDEVRGNGRTTLEQVSENGVAETSSADSLEVHFRSGASPASTGKTPIVGGLEGSSEIGSAVQQGHVVITRKATAKPGDAAAPQMEKATAARATYDGNGQKMLLTGGVEISNAGGTLSADHVTTEQKTGDAVAEGSIKASYRQGTQGEVTHVLAERAEMKKASDTTVFYGGAGRQARLWQGGSQVEAPVLEFAQKQRQLVARGDKNNTAMQVRTVLVSTGNSPEQKSDAAKGTNMLRRTAVVRIMSREMVYSDEARTAEFTGGVKVESSDGVMRGQQAVAYLEGQQAGKASKKSAVDANAGLLGGSVERVVVSGGIEIEQPARHATGERLVYTAGDGLFVLTGTQATPPRVVDQARGTVTGAELRFRAQDASVVISNGDANGAELKIRTETRVKRER